MQVQLLVERDQNECTVKMAGTSYKFKRNEFGHLVSDIIDQEHIRWVSDPMHNTSFKVYGTLRKKIIEEVIDDDLVGSVVEEVVADRLETKGPDSGVTEAPHLPPFPQKGSKRPSKRSDD